MLNLSIKKKNFFNEHKFIIMSFFLPILIMGAALVVMQVYPFGDRQILVTDFWQQYFPFFSDFWHKLRNGSLSEWSWSTGVGTNYTALAAYYLASPLNLLLGLFPHYLLREAITLMMLVKIGFSGMFCSLYLRFSFNRNDLSLPIFSCFYALCGFAVAYYWNLMWLDSFALLPLIVLGVRCFVYNGRWHLYVASLGLAMLFNYYIGYFCCLFTVVTFVLFSLIKGVTIKELFKNTLKMAVVSLISLGLSAVSLLPTLHSLSLAYSSFESFPKYLTHYENYFDIIGNFSAFTMPTTLRGLPNIYTGILCIVLLGIFLVSKSIPLLEKIGYVLVLMGLIVSCNVNALNFIWHGFHFTNMLPYRFSFLISFVLVIIAYRAFSLIEKMSKFDCLWAFLIGFGVIFAAYFSLEYNYTQKASIIFLLIYIFVLEIYRRGKLRRGILLTILFIVCSLELFGNALLAVNYIQTTTRSEYPNNYSDTQTLLEMQRSNSSEAFSRVEKVSWYTINDPSLYGYNGISLFSSTINAKTTTFLRHLGLMAWEKGNRYSYAETSPLANAFLGINQLISSDGQYTDTKHWEVIEKSGESLLLQNRFPINIGFMAENSLVDFLPLDDQNIFDIQNDLFKKATGLSSSLYTRMDITHVKHENLLLTRSEQGKYKYEHEKIQEPATFQWNYILPEDGQMYAYLDIHNAGFVTILRNGTAFYEVRGNRPYIFCTGESKKGDIISIRAALPVDAKKTNNVEIHTAFLNEDVFAKGIEELTDEQFEITNLSGSSITGNIVANKSGVLYLSVPYEKGWSAFVDGKRKPILTLDNSMMIMPLDEGTHEITITYRSNGLRLGLVISLLSLAVFIILIVLDRKKSKEI